MSKKKATTRSSAYTMVQHVWDHVQEATGHSWERLNAAMADALGLAIKAGLQFDKDDFRDVFDNCRGGYWGSHGTGAWEGYYASAIEYGNASAVQSFEAWKCRPPFIVDSVSPRDWSGPKTRVCIGTRFYWRGDHVTVTSFATDGTTFIACSYEPPKDTDSYGRGKIKKRHTISVADIRSDRKDRKERAALWNALLDWQGNCDKKAAAVTRVLKKFEISSYPDCFTVPLDTFREAVDKLTPEKS